MLAIRRMVNGGVTGRLTLYFDCGKLQKVEETKITN